MIRVSSTTFGERAPVWNYLYFFPKFYRFIIKIIKTLQKFDLQSSFWDPKRTKKGPRRSPSHDRSTLSTFQSLRVLRIRIMVCYVGGIIVMIVVMII